MRRIAIVLVLLMAGWAGATIREFGPGETYAALSNALAADAAGDTINIIKGATKWH